jgi:hypothetical protein
VGQILFSSGGQDIGNGFFIGIGGTTNQEQKNQQVVAVGGTYTTMYCQISQPNASPLTFTMRLNLLTPSPTLTCTVPANSLVGVGTGSLTFNAGDRLDVAAPASMPGGTEGTFAITP